MECFAWLNMPAPRSVHLLPFPSLLLLPLPFPFPLPFTIILWCSQRAFNTRSTHQVVSELRPFFCAHPVSNCSSSDMSPSRDKATSIRLARILKSLQVSGWSIALIAAITMSSIAPALSQKSRTLIPERTEFVVGRGSVRVRSDGSPIVVGFKR